MHAYLRHCRVYFTYAALFSLCINVLLLCVPLYMLQLFDRVLASRSLETLALLTLAAVGALLINCCLDVLRARLLSAAGTALDKTAAPAVLARALEPVTTLAQASSVRDVATLRGHLAGGNVLALFDTPWIPMYLGVIFLFHVRLGVIATIGAFVMVLLAWLNERLTRTALERARVEGQHAAACAEAGIRHRELIHALGMQSSLMQHWSVFNEAASDAVERAARHTGTLVALTKFARLALQIAMLAAGAQLVIDQHMTAGVMLTGTLILARGLAPIENAMNSWKALVDARAAYRRLDALFSQFSAPGRSVKLPRPRGDILVERAAASAPGATPLKGVSFSLSAGESLCVIGPSGAGKTALARLLVGVDRPASGAVRLDGADVSAWPRDQLGAHLGYLPQDAPLFPATVGKNIARLGEIDDALVVEAARRAGAHEMILRLPHGYQTVIGEGTTALSAGQRQRLALARALYGDPRFIVLDEPDVHLDGDAIEVLLQTLRLLREQGVTVTVISHRPGIVAQMDKALMLRNGQAELFGARAEVMARLARTATARLPEERGGPSTANVIVREPRKERSA